MTRDQAEQAVIDAITLGLVAFAFILGPLFILRMLWAVIALAIS